MFTLVRFFVSSSIIFCLTSIAFAQPLPTTVTVCGTTLSSLQWVTSANAAQTRRLNCPLSTYGDWFTIIYNPNAISGAGTCDNSNMYYGNSCASNINDAITMACGGCRVTPAAVNNPVLNNRQIARRRAGGRGPR